jgi:hypothetical protein
MFRQFCIADVRLTSVLICSLPLPSLSVAGQKVPLGAGTAPHCYTLLTTVSLNWFADVQTVGTGSLLSHLVPCQCLYCKQSNLQRTRDVAADVIALSSVTFGEWLGNRSELQWPFTMEWHESARELYRPSNSRLSAKLVLTFADRGSHVVSVTDPYSRIIGCLDRSRYFFFHVAPQLHSWG